MINNSAIQALREDTARLIAKFDEPEAQSSTIETNGGTATEISDEEYWWYRNHICHASEMIMTTPVDNPTLLEPILPRQGVVALVGSSDSGKSSLLRGLAMALGSTRATAVRYMYLRRMTSSL